MAKATKRGKKWRCLVFSHFEYRDGRKVRRYKSFTADSRKEAERQAAAWEYKQSHAAENMKVREAIEQYITIKASVISPSTYDAYNAYVHGGKYSMIEHVKLVDLDQLTIQRWVSSLTSKHKPKYVKNIYALFGGAMRMAKVDIDQMAPTLPQADAPEVYVPYDRELKELFAYLDDPDKYELRIACLLAAFGSLRRSEICALLPSDFDGNTVRVSKAMVRNGRGGWKINPHAKNDTSNRIVVLPQKVVDSIDLTRERVIDANPDAITNRFRRAVKYAGMDATFTLHSLRHYYASIAHALGIPDEYIMKMGGWKTDYIMKRNYRTTLSDVEKKEQAKLSKHFARII